MQIYQIGGIIIGSKSSALCDNYHIQKIEYIIEYIHSL